MKKEMQERIDEVKENVISLQLAVKEIRATGLNEAVILYAIQRNCESDWQGKKPNKSDIKKILASVETLEDYIFPPDEA